MLRKQRLFKSYQKLLSTMSFISDDRLFIPDTLGTRAVEPGPKNVTFSACNVLRLGEGWPRHRLLHNTSAGGVMFVHRFVYWYGHAFGTLMEVIWRWSSPIITFPNPTREYPMLVPITVCPRSIVLTVLTRSERSAQNKSISFVIAFHEQRQYCTVTFSFGHPSTNPL